MGSKLTAPFVLLLLGNMICVAQSFFSEKDLEIPECRTNGVSLLRVNTTYLFNFSTAEAVCKLVGLNLASTMQVSKAHQDGYETCSYGWVSDLVSVISRLQPNPKCGQNKTGVVPWNAPPSKLFHAYCFNSSDIWINSCKPDITTTDTTNALTKSAMTTQAETIETASHVSSTMLHILNTSATKPITSKTFTIQFTTESLPTKWTEVPKAKATLISDNVIFGGLPTALLVLALLFFAVAVALAVCYVKKYMKTVPVSSKKQKENVETKLLKKTTTGDNAAATEQKNGKAVENLESKPETVQCVEAAV
ncbi:lymphatic vessel endothelial hyaluronic acid receptor 1 [Rhinatrema bivittatum]|uniref:lymphatic vessel endothelial hyaluronic acid receptor 1 n=1 Tax=Rhinatrema bivittatum TaxID=194408 RepID=UPI00112EB310|nr:lymphatic vessel endothelial hyaluronic acid receptor 1 [Rhinatrema bivittatum]